MKLRLLLALWCLWAAPSFAQEHRVEKLEEAPPADVLSQEIAAQLNPTGVRVIRGTSRTVADIWLAKEWEIEADPPGLSILYPFKQGHLVGAVRFPRDGSDFRDQEIPEGVYTLRYGLQPVDGAHVGTFPTRDFLVLSKAETDQSAAPVEIMELVDRGLEASETAHPAILALLKLDAKAEAYPSVVHDEENDWWIVRLEGQAKAGGQTQKLPIDVVVAGYAAE